MLKSFVGTKIDYSIILGSKLEAVRVSLDNLTRILQGATKKRTLNPIQHMENSPLFKARMLS